MKAVTKMGALLLAASMLAAACGGDDDEAKAEATATTEAGADTDAASAEPVEIGAILDLTGNVAFIGKESLSGIELAAKEASADGREVKITSCDSESTPDGAMRCYDRLTQRDGIDLVMGPILAASTLGIAPRAANDGVLIYALGSGALDDQKTAFGAHPLTEDVLVSISRFAQKKDMTNVYVLATADATGQQTVDWFEKEQATDARNEARKALNLLGVGRIEATAQSAAAQIAQVDRDADLIILAMGGAIVNTVMAAHAEAGLDIPVMMLHSQGVPAVAAALGQTAPKAPVYVPSFCALAAASGDLPDDLECSKAATAFVDAWKAQGAEGEPNVLAAVAYDGVHQILQGVDATDGSGSAVAGWLEKQELTGSAGVYEYAPDRHRGLGPEALLIAQLDGGAWKLADLMDQPKA